MKLRDYLEKHNITQAEFADTLGMSRDVVSRWLRNLCYPTRNTALRIMKATKNCVTLKDIYG